MPHIRYFTLVLGLASLAGLTSCYSEVGELRTEYHDIIIRDGTQSFDEKLWAKASEAQRGKMLASLLRGHQFTGTTNTDVYRLLGDSTCYWEDEKNPCYWVILGDAWYSLAFPTAYQPSLGTVVKVSLYPRDTYTK